RGAAALLPASVAELVHELPVYTGAEKGPQPALRGIIGIEELFFQQAGEELLGKIFGILALLAPAQTHVFVNRTPVSRGNGLPGALSLLRVTAVRGGDHGMPRKGKCIALGS